MEASNNYHAVPQVCNMFSQHEAYGKAANAQMRLRLFGVGHPSAAEHTEEIGQGLDDGGKIFDGFVEGFEINGI